MISRLQPNNVKVLSLTTVATPHRGSAFADYMFDTIGPRQIKRLYKIMEYFGLETGAFSQLTRKFMQTEFNDKTPNVEGIRYVAMLVEKSASHGVDITRTALRLSRRGGQSSQCRMLSSRKEKAVSMMGS
jgi:hypothetical protein